MQNPKQFYEILELIHTAKAKTSTCFFSTQTIYLEGNTLSEIRQVFE